MLRRLPVIEEGRAVAKDAYENEARRANGLEARKEPASPSLANFFSRSTDEEEAPIRLTPLQKRAARRHRWRRAVEDDGIVWRGDDSSPASVVLELREDNAVIVEAAGATADLVGEGSLGHEYASQTKPDELERASQITVPREVPLVRAGIRFYKKRAGRWVCAVGCQARSLVGGQRPATFGIRTEAPAAVDARAIFGRAGD